MKRMSNIDDQRLLTHYLAKGDERCFRELVEKYLGMVLGCAQRTVGNRELAQEVAQNVFIALAKKGRTLNPRVPLGAWLHRATVYEATRARRKESVRKVKMAEFAKHMDTELSDTPEQWREVVPLVDAAVDRLSRDDRQVVVLRFFEGRTYRDIGDRVGKSEEAIRKQVTRALTKLSRQLSKLGVAISPSALGAGLGDSILEVIPGGELVGEISASAISTATMPTGAVLMGIQKALAATLIATVIPVLVMWSINHSYAQEVDRLEGEAEQLRLSKQGKSVLIAAKPSGTKGQEEEGINLQTLRAEFRQLKRRPHEMRRLFRVLALVHKLSEEQIPQAFEMFQSPPVIHDCHLRIYEALFTRWAKFNPQQALIRAKEVQWHALRLHSIEGVIKEWVVHDPEAALAAIPNLEMGLHQKNMVRRPATSALVEHDPLVAAAQFESSSGALRRHLMNSLSLGWAKQDPRAALSWAAGLTGEDREQALSNVMSQVALQDPIWALDTVLGSEDTANERMVESVFSWWVRTDLEGAFTALIEKVPLELRTEQVINPFCYGCSGAPVEKVLEWATHLPDENVTNKFLSRVAGYRRKDISESLQIVNELPEGKWREQAVSTITMDWISKDITAAEAWLESLPPSLSRDAGAQSLSRNIDRKDPGKATKWAARIQHPEWRAKTLKRAVQRWMWKDRAAASDWLKNTEELSREERSELRNIR